MPVTKEGRRIQNWKDTDDAIYDYSKVIKLDPNYLKAYNARANAEVVFKIRKLL